MAQAQGAEIVKLLTDTREPLFAARVKTRGPMIVYYDCDGFPACINFAREGARICSICRNACARFVVDDRGEYTCSACGKFPKELLLT
jgi:hypothetical protein